MNERIRELAEQATNIEEPDGLFPREVFDREKFAELILLECIPFVGDPTSEAVQKMMKHFGVEE